MLLKQKVYLHFQQLLSDKMVLLQNTLDDLKESGKNETKSTAGDKHETALAMLQIEQENKRKQLRDTLEQKDIFDKIDISISLGKVVMGSLVKTNHGHLFVSVALGKAVIDTATIIALSPHSPLGKKLMGAKVNDIIDMQNFKYLIEEIF